MTGLSRRQLVAAAAALTPLPALAKTAHGDAAAPVLTRLLGRKAVGFRLTVDSKPAAAPWYEVTAQGGHVAVHGSSAVAALRGAYAYLSTTGTAQMNWEGDRVASGPLPDCRSGRVTTPFQHRAYLNTCTFGYTTPFWDWKRWQREIDWMALHGIDMPLAMEGQDYVWRQLWQEQGLNTAELDAYFSGPAFTPWQRMGNVEGYQAPLPANWILKKRDLQKRILGAMRALGMEPILPAFGGYVPKAFADKHPEARIYKMRAWEGFHETWWLDPADPLFAKLAGRFLDLYEATYGKGRYWLADSFNEMLPPIGDGANLKGAYGDSTANAVKDADVDPKVKAERLAAYGKRIHDSIRQSRPDAVWVMQGWLFGADQKFWTAGAIAAFLKDVPDDGLMVLDIGNDRYANVHATAEAFHGKQWIYGYVHNYGGSNPVYGDLDYYRQDVPAIAADPRRGNLKGFGVFPEGLDTNSVVYEYLYELGWSGTPGDLGDWLTNYTRARYGRTSPELVAAWLKVSDGVFRTRYWTPRWWHSTAGAYLLCKRPDVAMAGYEGAPGDRAALKAGLSQLLTLSPYFAKAPLFRFDVVEFTRHAVSLDLDDRIKSAIASYQSGKIADGDAGVDTIKTRVNALDDLMGAQPWSLATWIAEARAYGDTPAERDNYEKNARAQVTVWGGIGNLHDYASKAWQGLYRDFYLPRWTMLFDALRAPGTFDQAAATTKITAWENDWVASRAPITRRAPADPIAAAANLLKL
ncbi:alpha-N-acetylglucosaminidase [Asticcacaulis solisilvae]|uniref:alpha-N-acetylglucosaminidase n=1 Tax=Asticcacaulis solisilvae TaxID=1217274 RepID=UPI003FD70651